MRNNVDQEYDLKIAIQSLKKTFGLIYREHKSTYTLRKLSSTASNFNRISSMCYKYLEDYLKRYSVYPIQDGLNQEVSDNLFWVIHPLEGKSNFIHKIPMISSRIDLMFGQESYISVIFLPLMKEIIACGKGIGCRIEVDNYEFGKRYTTDEHDNKLIAVNYFDSLHEYDQCIDLHNESVGIAYTACGYLNGFRIKNPSNSIKSIADLFMQESNGSLIEKNDVIIGCNSQSKMFNSIE